MGVMRRAVGKVADQDEGLAGRATAGAPAVAKAAVGRVMAVMPAMARLVVPPQTKVVVGVAAAAAVGLVAPLHWGASPNQGLMVGWAMVALMEAEVLGVTAGLVMVGSGMVAMGQEMVAVLVVGWVG